MPELADVTAAALGARPRLVSAERLRGGSKKGVYRLALADRSTVVAYIWSPTENFWTAQAAATGPFTEASGPGLFEASHSCLEAAGIPVPRVFCLDRSRWHFPADIAFVEDITGGSLEARLRQDPEAARPALARLGEAITAMHGHRSPAVGKVAEVRTAAGQAARAGPDRPSLPAVRPGPGSGRPGLGGREGRAVARGARPDRCRARRSAGQLRIAGIRAVVALDPEALPARARPDELGDALDALGAAAMAMGDRFGLQGSSPWARIRC